MRTKKLLLFVAMIMIISFPQMGQARPIGGCGEALTAAQTFIDDVLQRFGSWGGEPNPYVKGCEEFKDGKGRTIGYFVPVAPKGYIVFNTLTQLIPVLAYSESSDLNPTAVNGMAQLLRDYMGATRDFLEGKHGSLSRVPEAGIAPDSNQEEWNYYLKKGPRPLRESNVVVGPLLTSRWNQRVFDLKGSDTIAYGPGLSVSWHQSTPFNNSCPMVDGERTVVGCVATAASQIMKYWNYPYTGSGSHSYTWDGDQSCGGSVGGGTLSATFSDVYDWANMLDDYSGGYNTDQANAVAELCYEVGVAFEMDYGRCGSGATTSDASYVFPTYFRYANTTSVKYRSNYTNAEWFAKIREEFDNYLPRPIQYRIYKSGWGGHSVVCDGYDTTYSMIHINYGWDDSHTAWYTLDNLYCGSGDPCPANDQYMVTGIQPANRMYVFARGVSSTTLYYGYTFPNVSSWETHGASTHAPAMAVFNNRQYFAVKGSSGNSIYVASKGGTGIWSEWVQIPGQTDTSPVLVSYNNRLYLFVHGLDGNIYYKSMNSSGTWSAWSTVPGWASSDHPAATVVGDYLWLFAKGSGSNNSIYYRSFDGTLWGTTHILSGATNVAPAVVTFKPDTFTTPRIFLFVRGTDGSIYYRYTTSSNPTAGWSSWTSLGGSTPTTPSAAVKVDDNDLYVAVRGGDNGIYYRKYYLTTSMIWSSWSALPGGSTLDTPVINTYYFYNYYGL
ncbi:MAG: C10 family peptidase [Thermoproteota archaeon]